jgi:Protein of unknown function (DUF5674)
MKLIEGSISLRELESMAEDGFGDLVKAVVDIERGVMVVDAQLHSDEEALLLANGSRQADLWGINLYPGMPPDEWIEFDSMINVRPSQGNRSRGVHDPNVRQQVASIVASLVRR